MYNCVYIFGGEVVSQCTTFSSKSTPSKYRKRVVTQYDGKYCQDIETAEERERPMDKKRQNNCSHCSGGKSKNAYTK